MLTRTAVVPKEMEKKKKVAGKSHGVIVASSIAFKLSIHAFFKSLRFIGLTYKLQLEKILFSCELYICIVMFLFLLWTTFSEVNQSIVAIIYFNPI